MNYAGNRRYKNIKVIEHELDDAQKRADKDRT